LILPVPSQTSPLSLHDALPIYCFRKAFPSASGRVWHWLGKTDAGSNRVKYSLRYAMKFRISLVVLSCVLSFLVPADRLSDNCPDAWTAVSSATNFPKGLGVNIHFTDPQTGEIEMLAGTGFRWNIMDYKWDIT